ncbi:MAG: ankyrin repeat domain-containing protein [Gammaproteobacteria bacterium]|nr:ankyrin repeat domain-containing protein [Gammaproteobacteria bacterium]MDH5801407.1 ankyrin repeat domain-containing protein [Gammaproteobacteria bacterium]
MVTKTLPWTKTLLIMFILLALTACQLPARKSKGNDFSRATAAVLNGDAGKVQQVLKQHPYLINARDVDGHSLLHILAKPPAHIRNRTMVAETLINMGSPVDARLNYQSGPTPLHLAAQSNDLELIKTLLAHGADIHAKGATDKSTVPYLGVASLESSMSVYAGSPLSVALHYGNTASARLLVEKGAHVDAPELAAGLGNLDKFRELTSIRGNRLSRVKTGLLYLKCFNYAIFNQQYELADQLLLSGVNINGHHEMDNFTLLHLVAQRGNSDMARFLLQKGADPKIRAGRNQLTPLELALRHNNTRVANVLRGAR